MSYTVTGYDKHCRLCQNPPRDEAKAMFVKDVTSDRVVIETPAKINLFLKVLNKRPDGYHNINSLMQAVSLFDRLTIRRTAEPGVRITQVAGDPVPSDSSNLIARAFARMASELALSGGLEVTLAKEIPASAGLGGGSSDAAATLLAVNLLYDCRLDRNQLATIGAEIGSDVPFFFSSGQVLATGKGEVIETVELPQEYWLLLVKPELAVSTAAAYAELKRPLTALGKPVKFRRYKTVRDLVCWLHQTVNDFEATRVGENPAMLQIRQWLDSLGASLVRMSGSGPTMYGLFTVNPERELPRRYNRKNWWIKVVSPVRILEL
ncbi:MAG: 4-(cytidine 5'-diphospho)-2-C-methyl-D-erythritol kinase [Candidatus Zixiibacteriota bacterium]|nr:MAG: 4-(cytidine 5'-diphospho)-2-C-methyl-D-erythritol kinase [candidate division Zixibacteria bacterium]